MNVLITRPVLDATDTVNFLNENNISSQIDPMIIIDWLTPPLVDCSIFNHIIFTSKNGIRGFCQYNDNRDLTAWCVGDETASLAKKNSFKTIHSAQGSSHDLTKLIVKEIKPQEMLRICRKDQKDTLINTLIGKGYTITPLAVYKATPTPNLSVETINAFNQNKITDIVFYSPQSAHITVKNIHKANVTDACRNITAWCISKNTAQALESIIFNEIIIAKAPNQRDLLTPLIARKTLNG